MDLRRSLTFLLAFSATVRVARADDAGVVRVGGPCAPPGTSLSEVLRILQAELAPVRVTTLDSNESPFGGVDIRIAIQDCTEAPPGARVIVWNSEARTERLVVLTDATPATRDRTLALALAETVRGLRAAPVLLPSPAVIGPPAVPASAPTTALVKGAHADEPSTKPASVRVGVVGRFVTAESTPLVGVDAGVAWSRIGTGLTVLGTRRETSIGTVTLAVAAATVSLDAVDLGSGVRLRSGTELGVAIAGGSPGPSAKGRTVAAPHVALAAGAAWIVPVGSAWALEGFVGGGYASSLSTEVDGQRTLGLGGAFVTAVLGPRFP
jgi:hypothetical protein